MALTCVMRGKATATHPAPLQVAHVPPSTQSVFATPLAHPELFHHRMGEGLDTVAKKVAKFFPPDYQPQQSVREWLCSVSLGNLIQALDERIENIRVEDRMGLTGTA